MTFSERAVEAAARQIAFWQGQKIVAAAQSVASRDLGWKPDGGHLEEYADKHWRIYEDHAKAALTAALAVDGLALVPKEPTHAMIDAALSNGQANGKPWSVNFIPTLRAIYVAMLTAASDGEAGK